MKLKYFLLILPILFWLGCEDKQEKDCAGVEGGTAMVDSCDVCVGGTTNEIACTQDCADVFGGTATADSCGTCDSDLTNDCTQDCADVFGGTATVDSCGTCDTDISNDCVQDCADEWGGTAETDNCGNCAGGNTGEIACESVTGTYNITSFSLHPGGNCSVDDGISGMCFPNFGVSEAECPTGDCNCSVVMDGVTTEDDCDAADGDWDENNQECEQDCDATTEEECLAAEGEWNSGGFCMDSDGNGMEDVVEADCSANGGNWIVFGWNLYVNTYVSGMSATFADDGTFTSTGFSEPGAEDNGTWALDGSTLTITSSDGEVITATVSGNTISFELIEEADCSDNNGQLIDAENETACDAAYGDWSEAQCFSIALTNSGG